MKTESNNKRTKWKERKRWAGWARKKLLDSFPLDVRQSFMEAEDGGFAFYSRTNTREKERVWERPKEEKGEAGCVRQCSKGEVMVVVPAASRWLLLDGIEGWHRLERRRQSDLQWRWFGGSSLVEGSWWSLVWGYFAP